MNHIIIRYDELSHHGIKGQKWGVRRFQNEDMSLTPAGKKRYAKADKFDAKKERHISKIETSKTRLGKSFHNSMAYYNQIKASTKRDIATAKGIGEKLGARLGQGKVASIMDASEDFYTRQKDYRKTKLGKHLSSVHEYNAHNYGKAAEKTYQSKGLMNKGSNYVKSLTTTKVKSIVGRHTRSGEVIANAIISNMTNGKVNITALMDVGYLGVKAGQKIAEGTKKKQSVNA